MSAPVTFLIIDSTGHGGLARAVISVADALAAHREERVISVLRSSETPRFPLDPRIAHEVLVDEFAGLSLRERLLRRRPTRLAPGGRAALRAHRRRAGAAPKFASRLSITRS